MAAIDFPASPTLNQLFVAGNGVTYKWNGTVWVAQAASGGTGDFMATLTQQAGWLGGTNVVLLFNTVLTGNSGSWYNPATGRYTPPAGRYHIFASVCSYSSSAGAMTTQAVLRKNGAQVVQSQDTTETANSYSTAYASGVFDANGADYFDVVGWCNNSPSGNGLHWFCAFPLTGMQGPAGVISNGYRLISRVVPTAGQTSIDFTNLPSDINDLMLNFDITPTTNGSDLVLQLYDNTATLDTTAGHYAFAVTSTNNSAALNAAPGVTSSGAASFTGGIILNVSQSTVRPGNASGIRGRATIANIRDARGKGVDWQANYVSDNGTFLMCCNGNGWRGVPGFITGLRLAFGPSTFAAGGAITLWGSP